jgi:hypothetical protein
MVKIITNKIAKALNIIVKQQTKIHNAIYQKRLALDSLLTPEGGVCGKFNLSNCCLQSNDEKMVIKKITDKMKKLTHVPMQTWRDGIRGLFSTLSGFKTLIGATFLILETYLILFCLIPVVQWSFKTIMKATMIKEKEKEKKKRQLLM